MIDQTVYFHNPTWNILEGTNDDQRIGRKIQNVVVEMNFEFVHLGQAPITPFATISKDSYLRLMVLRSSEVKLGTGPGFVLEASGITANDIFFNPTQVILSHIDFMRWTVLMDRVYHVQVPNDVAVLNHEKSVLRRKVRIPVGRLCTYNRTTGSTVQTFLKQTELYIAIIGHCPGFSDSGERVGTFNCTGLTKFKDA